MMCAGAVKLDSFSPEISDLIIDYDRETLKRQPVRKDVVVARLLEAKNRRAAHIAARLPEHPDQPGVLDDQAIDGILLRSHLELQRLHEEFQNGRRVLSLLSPLLQAIRATGEHRGPLRVVDVGCGLGYVLRFLAARGDLGPDVELIGADYNTCFIGAAQKLAQAEGLRCRFVVANAFALQTPATVFISTGVLHHFRGAALEQLFSDQDRSSALAILHYDIRPSMATPIGAWIFHQARMREPLARHDGFLSALRAHSSLRLLTALRRAAPGFSAGIFDAQHNPWSILHLMQAAIGLRPSLRDPFLQALGARRQRFWENA
jgi:SAM-dependent methyltransferase